MEEKDTNCLTGCHSYKGYYEFSAIIITKTDKIAFMRESVLINKT